MAEVTIVYSWEEMVQAIKGGGATNIKFADDGSKYIEYVKITETINASGALTIDFNGWTIEEIEISRFTGNYKTLFSQSSTVKNLTVNHLNLFKTAPVDMFLFEKVYSSYFYDIWWESHDSVYTES